MAFHLIPLAGQAIQSIAKGLLNKAITNYFKDRTPSTQELALQELISVGRANKELREKELEISLLQIGFQHKKMLKEIELKEKQIQAEHDKTKWSSLLSRAEIQAIFSEQRKNHRLLVIASEPDMPEDLPLSFRDGLIKKVRNDLKRFSNNYYAADQMQGAVEFYGKFFDRAVFDAEIRQLKAVLPVPTVVIYCDITHHEAYFNVEYLNGEHSFSFNTDPWVWKEAEEQLRLAGMNDEHKRLFEIQTILVKMHQTLLAFLTDWYYLQLSPFYQPQLFELKDNFSEVLPAEWISDCTKILQQIQRANLDAYQAEVKRLQSEGRKKGTPQTFSSVKAGKQVDCTIYEKTFDINGVPLVMVYIPAGSFQMGSNTNPSEKPLHKVRVEKPFYMGKYPIIQKQWQAVMNDNPSSFKGDHLPVESIYWKQAKEFCEKLSELLKQKFDLPSEAQWEYACRAETTTNYWWGDSIGNDLCWYNDNSGGEPHLVDEMKNIHESPFGLCDMHGNVWEWCEDVWHGNYVGAPSDGSAWTQGNETYRILRGGSWSSFAGNCCSSARSYNSGRYSYCGFRVAWFPNPQDS